jgi:hypothetical protein
MHVIEPVIVMCLIGAVVGLLLRGRATRYLLSIVGVWLVAGITWSALCWTFLRIFAPAEAVAKWPDDLPNLLRAIAFSGLVALIPALIVSIIPKRRFAPPATGSHLSS